MNQNGVRDVSVVICAYTEDRWNDLVEAVESMRNQSLPPQEIIIVIDHNLALLERVRTHISGIVAIENGETRGLSGARNTGIALAQGELIAFMDEDAVAEPDWLAQLSADYEDTQVMGVGGAIESWWLDGRPGWFPEEFDWVVGCTYRGMPTTTAPVRNLIGCNMSFRRTVFEAIGGFRHGIGRVGTRPVGDEETEICIRASQHRPQGIFLYEPQARVHHRVPTTRARWRYFWARCYAEGLSKALLSSLVGAKDGLSSERTYTFRTLPLGVKRGIAGTFQGQGVSGLARAAAILTGLAVTTAGYLTGTVLRWIGASESTSGEAPTFEGKVLQ